LDGRADLDSYVGRQHDASARRAVRRDGVLEARSVLRVERADRLIEEP